jgi:hypothetical protein
VHAWPTRLAYSQLNALGDENVIETLELAYERFTME